MEIVATVSKILTTIAVIGFLGLVVRLYNSLVSKPKKLRSILRERGINGPPQSLLLGNIRDMKKAVSANCVETPPPGQAPLAHNVATVLFPFFEQWRKQYGTYT